MVPINLPRKIIFLTLQTDLRFKRCDWKNGFFLKRKLSSKFTTLYKRNKCAMRVLSFIPQTSCKLALWFGFPTAYVWPLGSSIYIMLCSIWTYCIHIAAKKVRMNEHRVEESTPKKLRGHMPKDKKKFPEIKLYVSFIHIIVLYCFGVNFFATWNVFFGVDCSTVGSVLNRFKLRGFQTKTCWI